MDGRDVRVSSNDRPVRLDPERPTVLRVRVHNGGDRGIGIRTVRLEGKVMGLSFFRYDTSVGMRVGPGASEDRVLELDLGGMRDEAVGLISSAVVILDEDRRPLAKERLVVDVRGSLRSVYGVFGLAVAAFTVVSLSAALIRLGRRTLPDNRWLRALRFGAPGLGLGLTLVFTLSALRVYAPVAGKWIPLVAVCAVGMFLLGYLTPAPESPDDELDEGDEGAERAETLHADTLAASVPTPPPPQARVPAMEPMRPVTPATPSRRSTVTPTPPEPPPAGPGHTVSAPAPLAPAPPEAPPAGPGHTVSAPAPQARPETEAVPPPPDEQAGTDGPRPQPGPEPGS